MDVSRIGIDLLKLFLSGAPEEEVYQYIIKLPCEKQLDIYIPVVTTSIKDTDNINEYIPLIYYLCKTQKYSSIFYRLLEKGYKFDVTKESIKIDINPALEYNAIELLYYCDYSYIEQLYTMGYRIKNHNFFIEMILNGHIKKVFILFKVGAIDKAKFKSILETPLLPINILNTMYELIFFTSKKFMDSNEQGNSVKFSNAINIVFENYLGIFKLLIQNGINLNIYTEQQEGTIYFSQMLLNTYFTPLIEFCLPHLNLNSCKLIHFSNFHINNKVVLKYFYNMENYSKLKELVDKITTPKKIVKMKTTATSKTIIHN